MKDVTKEMIKIWSINKLGHDMMGYEFDNKKELSFHHLIVPHRECKEKGLGQGYYIWNGAILVQDTAHEYLHKIESYDYDRFIYITSELIDINTQREIVYDNVKNIHDCLCGFEREYSGLRTSKGKSLIKPEYVRRRIKR